MFALFKYSPKIITQEEKKGVNQKSKGTGQGTLANEKHQ